MSVAAGDLHDFSEFLIAKLAKGETKQSPEMALNEWRDKHPPSSDLAAMREAYADIEAGDEGMDADEFFEELRILHNWPPRK